MLNKAKTDFKKVKKDFLNQDYTFFDMHYHSRYSDGRSSIPQIVKKARRLGIGVAVTDHNEIRGALEIAKYEDVPSIPGIEVTTKEGIHVLLYFYTAEELSSFYNHIILPSKRSSYSLELPISDLINYAKDFNNVIVAPHPFSISWMGVCDSTHKKIIDFDFLKEFEAIEVINGENLHRLNLKALKLSEMLKKPVSGGSDGHTIVELGHVLTYVKEKGVNPKSFLNQLKKGNTFVLGKESNMVSKVVSQSNKITVPAKDPLSYAQKSYRYIKKVISVSH
ncbi:hypothetical protein C0585_03970 [Candidatus Woesearchaeota archaeon]|nr:MAG: hypothetical protein C0585_03970 [Candidatus Woesearchaeota archaeon]